jgi:pimeloyl-ACP methyl ester carboxylesterase
MQNEWLNKAEYPFRPIYFSINGQKLHYIDEGSGPVILFIHGTPSWSFDFRNVIKKLRSDYRCIAIDHIGFGLSDKPEHYDYSTLKHSVTLQHFIAHMQLTKFTMVVHDFGGPIGLHVAINNPTLIERLVVLNSWLWNSKGDPHFEKFSKILRSPLLPFLYRQFNFSPRFVMPSSFGSHKLSAHLRKQYTRPFADRRQRNGTLAFADSLLRDQEWFGSLWSGRRPIQAIPLLLIWGMKDPVVGPEYLTKFASGFNNTVVRKLYDCGHFPQEEHTAEVAAYISEFLG